MGLVGVVVLVLEETQFQKTPHLLVELLLKIMRHLLHNQIEKPYHIQIIKPPRLMKKLVAKKELDECVLWLQ